MEPAALRIAPIEAQTVFPWLDQNPNMVLAIPAGDVERYRKRDDVKDLRWISVDYSWTSDPRYHKFLAEAAARTQPAGYLWCCCLLMGGYLAGRPSARWIGVASHGEDIPQQVRRRWFFPDAEDEAFETALAVGCRAGMFVMVDTSIDTLMSAYGSVRARTRGPALRPARVPERTDPKERTEEKERRGAAVPQRREIAPQITAPRTATAREPNDERRDGLLGSDARVESLTFGKELERLRRELDKPPYPASGMDMADLLRAFTRADEQGRIDDLKGLLREVAHWAKSGGGFREKMREAGYLA